MCVFDKRRGTLRLVPTAERGSIFALEQRTKEYDGRHGSGIGENDMTTTTAVGGGSISASDRMQMLVDSFGSRKKQKVMNSRASNRVNIHSVVGTGEVMMESVAGQEGISRENKRGMMEGGGAKVSVMLFFLFVVVYMVPWTRE